MTDRSIATAQRWFLLVLVAVSPWCYGCLTDLPRTGLTAALLLLALVALGRCVASGNGPAVPRFPALLAVGIFTLGWFMTLNARARLDWLWHLFEPVDQWIPFLPGTWDAPTSIACMLTITGLLTAFAMSLDLAGDPVWRRRLRFVVAVSGTALIAFGLVERLTGADSMFWRYGVSDSLYYPTFFATFHDDGNAGSFINLVLPFLLAPLLTESAAGIRSAWIGAVLIALAGAVTNTSRGAQVITVLILIAFFSTLALRHRRINRPVLALAGLFVGATALLFFVLAASVAEETWVRTFRSLVAHDLPVGVGGRITVYTACIQALPAAGWFGLGPGTFEITFPFFTSEWGAQLSGVTRTPRSDALQCLLEWGPVGATLWFTLLAGGIFRHPISKFLIAASEDWPFAVALIGVLLHALIDAPFQVPAIALIALVLAAQLWKSPPAIRR